MDENRRFRFLIPPFFLVASLIWGAYLADVDLQDRVKGYSTETIIALAAAVGASAIPVGFLLTSISVLILRGVFGVWGGSTYEAKLPRGFLDRIWPLLKSSLSPHKKWTLYAAATFDHELLSPGIHEWLLRRWTSFNISVHSIVAIALSHLIGRLLQIRQTPEWKLTSAAVLVVLALNAVVAWRHTMKMLDFQSYRHLEPRGKPVG